MLYYNLKPQNYPDGNYVAPLVKAGVTLEGDYLYYLGIETPQNIISYSKLAQGTALASHAPDPQLSTELVALPRAA